MAIIVDTAHSLNMPAERISRFYKKNWPKNIALTGHEFYQWQFLETPCADKKDHNIIAFDESADEIAGVMGVSPREFFLEGESLRGGELTTWIVKEEYKKTSAASKIIKFIQENYEIVVGMGISDDAFGIYLKSGFRYSYAIPRFVKVLDFDVVSSIFPINNLAKKVRLRRISEEKKYSYIAKLDWDSRLIDQSFGIAQKQFNMFARGYTDILWRYKSHPSFVYHCAWISRPEDSINNIFIAIREEASIAGVKIAHVTDCVGSPSVMLAAIQYIEDYCEKNGVHVVDFSCTSELINHFFVAKGWFSVLNDRYFEFPHLFHPIEYRKPASTSLIYWSKNNLVDLCDFTKLYITKQDCDFDRPVPMVQK